MLGQARFASDKIDCFNSAFLTLLQLFIISLLTCHGVDGVPTGLTGSPWGWQDPHGVGKVTTGSAGLHGVGSHHPHLIIRILLSGSCRLEGWSSRQTFFTEYILSRCEDDLIPWTKNWQITDGFEETSNPDGATASTTASTMGSITAPRPVPQPIKPLGVRFGRFPVISACRLVENQ